MTTSAASRVITKYERTILRYERVKLALVLIVLVVVLTVALQNRQSLIILKCAVSQEVQDARAKAGADIPMRDIYARRAYEACVKRGGPLR